MILKFYEIGPWNAFTQNISIHQFQTILAFLEFGYVPAPSIHEVHDKNKMHHSLMMIHFIQSYT